MKTTITTVAAVVLLVLVAASPAIYMLITGDFPGASRFYGFEEDSAVVSQILTVRENFVGVAK